MADQWRKKLERRLLADFGPDPDTTLGDLLTFEPGHAPPVSDERAEWEEAIAHARDIRVEEVELISAGDAVLKIYSVTLSCLQELTRADIQRLIALGRVAAAAEDEAELAVKGVLS